VLWSLPEDYGRIFHCSDLSFQWNIPLELVWQSSLNLSIQHYLPLESMLLEPPNRCLGGLDRSYMYGIDVVEIDRIPRRRMEDNIHSNTAGLEGLVGPVGPVGHCCYCSCGRGSPQSIRIDLWAL